MGYRISIKTIKPARPSSAFSGVKLPIKVVGEGLDMARVGCRQPGNWGESGFHTAVFAPIQRANYYNTITR